MNRIFITGNCGFLGSHISEALIHEGYEVAGNDTLICGSPDNAKCEWHNVDCCNFDGMKTILDKFHPDVLVHTAALAHEGLSTFSPSYITKSIFGASVATFSAAISSGVERIVNLSSMSRYGAGSPPFTEEHPTAPVDCYGIAKVAAEDALKNLCKTHGVKWSILVPHNVIGIRQRSIDPARNVAAIMINRCKQGKPPIIYGDGMQMRCFSPVKDCLPSIVKAVHGDGDGEVVNIGPDHSSMTINELAVQIMNLTNFEGEPIYVPGRPNEVKDAYCSSDKARRLLGFSVKQSLMDCLKEMVDYIKPEPFLYDFPIEIVTERTPKTWTEKQI